MRADDQDRWYPKGSRESGGDRRERERQCGYYTSRRDDRRRLPCSGPRHCRPPTPHARSGELSPSPSGLVEAMHVLLVVEVAGEPGEIVPVAQLELHLGPARLPRAERQRCPPCTSRERCEAGRSRRREPVSSFRGRPRHTASRGRKPHSDSSSSPLRSSPKCSARPARQRPRASRRTRACRRRSPASDAPAGNGRLGQEHDVHVASNESLPASKPTKRWSGERRPPSRPLPP